MSTDVRCARSAPIMTRSWLALGVLSFGVLLLILVATQPITVTSKAGHHINPDRNYWRNQQKSPGRWPRRAVTNDATQYNRGVNLAKLVARTP
jgi:hypothetical protein